MLCKFQLDIIVKYQIGIIEPVCTEFYRILLMVVFFFPFREMVIIIRVVMVEEIITLQGVILRCK